MSRGKENYEDDVLAGQIPEFVEPVQATDAPTPKQGMVGSKLGYKQKEETRKKDNASLVEEKHLTRVGEKIGQHSDIRDGWMEFDRALLGDRDIFYPEDWVFRIKPASVEVVKNWSTVDEENPNSIDTVFNEVCKYSISIKDGRGNSIPYNRINDWDRFFFILLVHDYTFIDGEHKVEFTKECPECDGDVEFSLNVGSLEYDTPDESVLKYYDRESQTWNISPAEFDVASDDEYFTLYLPTLEKDANIKEWMFDKYREDENAKIDAVFIKFLPWLAPKISKDINIAKKQIKSIQTKFKTLSTDEFGLLNDIINNIVVTPSKYIKAVCPTCGEEVSSRITFPNGLGALFTVVNKSRKFGTK